MNLINCSHRLPPAPSPGEVTPYPVILKLPTSQIPAGRPHFPDHKGYETGYGWDGRGWLRDGIPVNPKEDGVVVQWAGPIAPVVSIVAPIALTPVVEEPSAYNVVVTGYATTQKISVIKVIRELTGLGLGESKATVEGLSPAKPFTVKGDIPKPEATRIHTLLAAAGAQVVMEVSS